MEEVKAKQIVKSSGILQSEELYKYILETSVYPREPQLLKELRDATAVHPWSGMIASSLAGQLIGLQLKLLNAKKTLEVGVFTGYSLLLTALSLPPDGQITAMDMDREAYEVGLPFIRRAGMEHKINFIHSQALPALDNLLEQDGNEGSYDFAFIDADKTNYLNYHERILKLVRVGGLAIYDNTLWGGTVAMPEELVPEFRKESRQAVIKFNKFLANDPRIEISHVPAGDGITICMRLY